MDDEDEDIIVKYSTKKRDTFIPDKVELTEDQKQFSNQNPHYRNLLDKIMTPRPTQLYELKQL
jgi:hypothetical protein